MDPHKAFLFLVEHDPVLAGGVITILFVFALNPRVAAFIFAILCLLTYWFNV